MRTSLLKSKLFPILTILFGMFACLPLLSNAHAAANQDNWGPDQLNGSIPPGGGSFTLDNISCSGSGVKIIAEDQNGCFLYQVVACNDNVTWTITNDTVPDCGQ